MRHAHSTSAAARGRLDDHRVLDLLRDPQRDLFIVDGAVAARNRRHLRFARQLLARDLVADRRHRLDRRADEFDPAAPANLREVVVLSQESITRMDRLHVGDLGGGNDPRDVEVRLGGRRVADADRLVRQLQVRRVLVRGGIDHRRLHAHLAAGADDPQCDLAPVCDEDLRKHVSC